jgi:hypothetical protein
MVGGRRAEGDGAVLMKYASALLVLGALGGCAGSPAAPGPVFLDGSHVRRLVESLANLHMRPLDRWIQAGTGYEPIPLDKEVHYALVIRPEQGKGPTLFYRMVFQYAVEHHGAHHYTPQEPWVLLEEKPLEYAARKVDVVREALKTELIDAYLKNDPERIETLTFGTSYFCRMPTEHSDPLKVRPDDVVSWR